MKISNKGLELIKEFEGLSLTPYLCDANRATIGYGNTYYSNGRKVTLEDDPITEEEATKLLEYVVDKDFSKAINKFVKVELNQNQFDALVSFCYNIGRGAFETSTLLRKLNRSDYTGASNEFERWNKAGGEVLEGLTRRRLKEKELFLA